MYFPDKENLTKLDETIIQLIRWWPNQFYSAYDVLTRYLLRFSGNGDEWDNNGNFTGFDRPLESPKNNLSYEYGLRQYLYGHQNHVTMIGLDWTEDNVINCAPDNISQVWLDQIENLISYYCKFPQDVYEVHILSKYLTTYDRNTVGFHHFYPRAIKGWRDAMSGLDRIAERFGWEQWVRANYHSKEKQDERKAAINELIDRILKNDT